MSITTLIQILSFARSNNDGNPSKVSGITQGIQEKVRMVAFEIILGLIIMSMIIFSLLQLGDGLDYLLRENQHKFIIEMGVYGFCSLFGLTLLYLLFIGYRKRYLRNGEKNDINSLTLSFVRGFMEGLKHK